MDQQLSKNNNNNALIRPIGIAASIVTILEGLVWTILALLKILIHHGVWEWDYSIGETYTGTLDAVIYILYLKRYESDQGTVLYISPNQLNIWAWIYFPISIVWVCFSGYLIWTLIHKNGKPIYIAMSIWVVVTAVISILDLVLFSLLSSDYSFYMQNYDDQISKMVIMSFYFLACGIMQTLAIRGYVLWIVNVTFLVILTKFVINYIYDGVPNEFSDEPSLARPRQDVAPINAYQSSTNNVPADPWTHRSESTSYVGIENPGYDRSSDIRPPFIRSHSFSFPEVANNNNNNNNNNKRYGMYLDNRPPPLNLNAPFIPDPDYTPPGTPTRRPVLKSVLKQRSHYK